MSEYQMKVIPIDVNRPSIDVRIADQSGIDWTRDVAHTELPIKMLLIARITLPDKRGKEVTIRFKAPVNARFLDEEGNHIHLRMPASGEVEVHRPIEFMEQTRLLGNPWTVEEV